MERQPARGGLDPPPATVDAEPDIAAVRGSAHALGIAGAALDGSLSSPRVVFRLGDVVRRDVWADDPDPSSRPGLRVRKPFGAETDVAPATSLEV
jgi:hypothetical protein